MKLHFEPNLDYQLQAIEAVCDLFRGQETCRTEFTVTLDAADKQKRLGFAENDLGIGNERQRDSSGRCDRANPGNDGWKRLSGGGGRCPPDPLGFFALALLQQRWTKEPGEPPKKSARPLLFARLQSALGFHPWRALPSAGAKRSISRFRFLRGL